MRVPVPRRPSTRSLLLAAGLVAAAALVLAAHPLATRFIAGRLRASAAARGLSATWRRLAWRWRGDVRVDSLALTDAGGDTVIRVRTMTLAVGPLSVLALRPRPRLVVLDGARLRLKARAPAEPDTVPDELPPAPPERSARTANPERARRLRSSAEQAVRMLFLPARSLPRVMISDLVVAPAATEDALVQGVRIDTFRVDPSAAGIRLRTSGTVRSDHDIPFDVAFDYGRDDRLAGLARFRIPDTRRRTLDTLALRIDGRVRQDNSAGAVRLGDATRVTIGALPLSISGSVWRRGPRVELDLRADRLDEDEVHAALPPSMLGSLRDVSVRGTFDYRLHFDLDFARPESVEFRANVIPHALRLDPARTALNLALLDAPFTAAIHLPRGRVVTRELGPDNPHFRTLDRIDSLLAYAVVTNEDGGFFRHRGFNTDAVKRAIAENIRAGAYRRGAGTITMQLARNLWLGHERTLSRKMQEVVLAWILEHLTGVSKRRLLEVYLNIIEWGPDVQGADEAAWYFFGHGAGSFTLDEALFLTTVIPAPTKWKYRFDAQGALRPFERAQMHFIGRALVAKGWLDPAALPPADSLRVELRGPARSVLFPAPADSMPPPPAGSI